MYEEYFNYTPQEKMRTFFLRELASQGLLKHYKKNDQVDYYSNSKLSIVVKGKLKICIYTKSGLEKILFFLLPGEIYGEESLFYPHIDITPVPLEDTTISFIDNDVLEEYMASNSMCYSYFFQSILRKYQISLFQMGDLLKHSPQTQICSALSRMAIQSIESTDSNTKNIGEIIIPLTHEVIANLIGCSRVTVTRVLNDLRKLGIIDTSHKEFKILDLERLKNLSE
ncbi:MAG: Crp/Fnr family transcriptional regulator [Clostridium sp.]|uniref:Crp/Fnr family transcriptional regulator n=1 Tax=Clostridium sp. TaxID=1506 RepID=UPI00303DE52A